MNKYENILKWIGKILGFCFAAAIPLGLTAMPLMVMIFVGDEVFGAMILLFEFCFCSSVHIFSYAMGLFFFGDRYVPTGYVNSGRSLDWPVETYKYVKRNMITNFVEVISCVVFFVVYIFMLCSGLYNGIAIAGMVASVIGFVIFYLFYKKQQYKLKHGDISNKA